MIGWDSGSPRSGGDPSQARTVVCLWVVVCLPLFFAFFGSFGLSVTFFVFLWVVVCLLFFFSVCRLWSVCHYFLQSIISRPLYKNNRSMLSLLLALIIMWRWLLYCASHYNCLSRVLSWNFSKFVATLAKILCSWEEVSTLVFFSHQREWCWCELWYYKSFLFVSCDVFWWNVWVTFSVR